MKSHLKAVHSLEQHQTDFIFNSDETLYSHCWCHVFTFKVLLLPSVLCLVQVFAQVLGLLLWLSLTGEWQRCFWQSSEKHTR